MQDASVTFNMPIDQAGFLKKKIPKEKGGDMMFTFHVFALTFTLSINHSQSAQQQYEDRKRIDALRNKIIDKRFEHRRYIR
ncbi:hypothetical protein ACFP7A_01640 [Sporolactobacillus kofuensis]|uniref:YrzI family small protein n=1 Tax=Sporolactobacillus kofuensis TaxID=269672 RepID=A0ABW1WCR3_9BACL|nr:hypothetical protein [Sporolactobacillus kofuensis]MCO7175961.1 hypothetical protein [Sporolactobacillus kofuensis]